jgi:hypothetical protein
MVRILGLAKWLGSAAFLLLLGAGSNRFSS